MKRFTATIASSLLLALATVPAQAADSQAHKGQGTVNSVDTKAGKVNLTHGPISSLNWPGMTMDFQVKDNAVLKGVAPGQKVEFNIAQTGPSQFVITRITPAARKK